MKTVSAFSTGSSVPWAVNRKKKAARNGVGRHKEEDRGDFSLERVMRTLSWKKL